MLVFKEQVFSDVPLILARLDEAELLAERDAPRQIPGRHAYVVDSGIAF
jgi:hypothetical protein